MTEQRPDLCPVCNRLIPGEGVVIHCDICGTTLLPVPNHAPTHPPADGSMVYAWNNGRWIVCVQEEDGWMPW